MTLQSINRFFQQNAYRREITLVILLKLMALMVLWKFFIPTSAEKHPTRPVVVQHFMVDQVDHQ